LIGELAFFSPSIKHQPCHPLPPTIFVLWINELRARGAELPDPRTAATYSRAMHLLPAGTGKRFEINAVRAWPGRCGSMHRRSAASRSLPGAARGKRNRHRLVTFTGRTASNDYEFRNIDERASRATAPVHGAASRTPGERS
jgi:hypothetical protein